MGEESNIYANSVIVAEDVLKTNDEKWIGSSAWQTRYTTEQRTIVDQDDSSYHYCVTTHTVNTFVTTLFCREADFGKCLAEVIFVRDGEIAGKYVKSFKPNDTMSADGEFDVVVRILEPKNKFEADFARRWAMDLIIMVNGEECLGDRLYLSAISPVFRRMLNGNFAEAEQSIIDLKDISSADIFNDFLLAISHDRVQPNPDNVAEMLRLAHYFDIPTLVSDCERRLLRCYEIPVIERIVLAGEYGLNTLKMRIGHSLKEEQWMDLLSNNWDELRNFGIDFYMSRMLKSLKCKNDSN